MSLALKQINAVALGGTLAREISRIEDDRLSWRKALIDADRIGKQVRELAENSAYAKMAKVAKEIESMQSAISIAKRYESILGSNPTIGSAYRMWQESERLQLDKMRRLLNPMDDIRKRALADTATQQIIKELTAGISLGNRIQGVTKGALGIGAVAISLAQQAEDSRVQTKKHLEGLGVGSSIHIYLKEFERISKQWKVPNEVLGIVGTFKELHDQLGSVALPTIDWGSAAALSRALGPEGIQEQLELLGIEADGSMHEFAEKPEKGLLSRKQSDALAMLSLLLTILFFIFQENSSELEQAKMEAFQTQTTHTLQVQMQQIQSLTVLIGKALVSAGELSEERFVVRDRMATVRSKPEHGSAAEGKLMPNEVVRAINKDGKWIEIEYYHWLREEYRTGWVLKKYLERVPVSYQIKAP